ARGSDRARRRSRSGSRERSRLELKAAQASDALLHLGDVHLGPAYDRRDAGGAIVTAANPHRICQLAFAKGDRIQLAAPIGIDGDDGLAAALDAIEPDGQRRAATHTSVFDRAPTASRVRER